MRSLAVAAVLLAATVAHADPVIDRVVVVGRSGPGAPWTDAATEARAGAGAELAVVAIGRDGKRRVVLADPALRPLRLEGRAVADRDRRVLDLAALGAEVQWSIVEPHGFRARPAANGATSDFYSNVSTERGDFGRWLGYDRIDYFATVVRPWGGAARIPAAIESGDPDAVQVAGAGTTRYQVALRWPGGAVVASPGVEAVDAFGLTRAVHRVSIRRGDDFLGWLSSYLLVPEVFGSAGGGRDHQTERFTGADCADVMVGALRKSGRRDVPYTNVAGLPRYARTIADAVALDDRGMPAQPIAGVAPGDLIRINYGGALTGHTPRAWDHVAALWEDRSDPAGPAAGGPDGQLDGFDLVVHMGHPRLVIEPLAAQAPATVDVLRWRARR